MRQLALDVAVASAKVCPAAHLFERPADDVRPKPSGRYSIKNTTALDCSRLLDVKVTSQI